MSAKTIQSAHCAELAQGRHTVYRVFDTLSTSGLEDETQVAIRNQLAGLVDFIIWQDLRVDTPSLCKQLQRALTQEYMDPAELVRAWTKAVTAGLPSRSSCKELLLAFFDYCDLLPSELRPALARGISPLSPFIGEWGKTHSATLVAEIGAVRTTERVEALLKTVASYTDSDAKIMRAAVQIAVRLLKADRTYILDILTQEVTIDKMMESRDACRLLPLLAKAIAAAEATHDECGPDVAACVLAISKINISSACAAASKLRKSSKHIPADRLGSYVRHVESLTTKGNIRLLGFCLHTLPSLTRQHSPEALDAFVSGAIQAADSYGVNAAEAFLRRETPAAKSALTE